MYIPSRHIFFSPKTNTNNNNNTHTPNTHSGSNNSGSYGRGEKTDFTMPSDGGSSSGGSSSSGSGSSSGSNGLSQEAIEALAAEARERLQADVNNRTATSKRSKNLASESNLVQQKQEAEAKKEKEAERTIETEASKDEAEAKKDLAPKVSEPSGKGSGGVAQDVDTTPDVKAPVVTRPEQLALDLGIDETTPSPSSPKASPVKKKARKRSPKKRPAATTPKKRPAATTPKKRPASPTPKRLPAPSTPKRLPAPSTPKRLPAPSTPKKLPAPSNPKKLPIPTTPKKLPASPTPKRLPAPPAPKKGPGSRYGMGLGRNPLAELRNKPTHGLFRRRRPMDEDEAQKALDEYEELLAASSGNPPNPPNNKVQVPPENPPDSENTEDDLPEPSYYGIERPVRVVRGPADLQPGFDEKAASENFSKFFPGGIVYVTDENGYFSDRGKEVCDAMHEEPPRTFADDMYREHRDNRQEILHMQHIDEWLHNLYRVVASKIVGPEGTKYIVDSTDFWAELPENGESRALERNRRREEFIRTIKLLGLDFDNEEDRQMVAQLYAMKFAWCPDVDGHIGFRKKRWDKDLKKYVVEAEIGAKFSADDIAGINDDIARNLAIGKHPLAFSDMDIKKWGRNRWTLPIYSKEMAAKFCAKCPQLRDKTPQELMVEGLDEWNRVIRPSMMMGADPDQKVLILRFANVLVANAGWRPQEAGFVEGDWGLLDEHLNAIDSYATAFGMSEKDYKNAHWRVVEEMRDAYTRQCEMYTNKKMVNGQPVTGKSKSSMMAQVVTTITSWAKALGVMSPEIGLGSLAEKADGHIVMGTLSKIRMMTSKTKVPDHLYQVFAGDEGRDAVRAYRVLMMTDGKEAVAGFLDTQMDLTMANVQNYIAEAYPSGPNMKNKVAVYLNRIGRYGSIMAQTGDFAFTYMDSRRFIESFAYRVEYSRKHGTAGAIKDIEQINKMFMGEPLKAMRELAKTPEFANAMIEISQTTAGAINPISMAMTQWMNQHPFFNAAFSLGIDKYLTYSVNILGRLLPFSHSGCYLLNHGLQTIKMDNGGELSEMSRYQTGYQFVWELDENGQAVVNSDEFWKGLRDNLAIDLMWIGEKTVFSILGMAILCALGGIEPPDDEDKILDPYEWKIMGTTIKDNWWLQDVVGIVGPLPIVGCAYATGRISLEQGWHMLSNAFYDTLDGSALFDCAEILYDFANGHELERARWEKSEQYDMGEINQFDWLLTNLQSTGLTKIAQLFEPKLLTDIYNEAGWFSSQSYAHSKTRVFTLRTDDDADATEQTSYNDAMLRSAAYNHYAIGILLNFMTGNWWSNDGEQKTGYLKDQMPLVTIPDPTGAYWVDALGITNSSTDEEKMAAFTKIIDLYNTYDGDYSMIAAQGVVIPYDCRGEFALYCDAQKQAAWSAYYAGSRTNAAYQSTLEAVNYWKAMKSMMYTDDIPYTSYKYYRWETDYDDVWYRTDNDGDTYVVDSLDHLNPVNVLTGQQYTREYYAAGNHKSSFNPFVIGDDRWNIYDLQTAAAWIDFEKTDPEILEELYKDAYFSEDAPVPDQYKGGSVLAAIKGDQTSSDWMPTMGQRAHVSNKEEAAYMDWDDEIEKYYSDNGYDPDTGLPLSSSSYSSSGGSSTKSSSYNYGNGSSGSYGTSGALSYTGDKYGSMANYNTAAAGGYNSNNSSSSSSSSGYGSRSYSWSYGGSSYSYGSSGSSYTTKIYSNPASSISADKASTMYSKTPYTSSYDYLNPDFETKGSREAYKRSDI